MEQQFTVQTIGRFFKGPDGTGIQMEPPYLPALAGLRGFSHLNILWWFSRCDNPADRETLQEPAPYRTGPDTLGVFATRSPRRPNPLALSCVAVTHIDEACGTIGIAWTDADPGSPVLDIKPYTPSLDRVDSPSVPGWCAHWPLSLEASAGFDWAAEFNA